MWGDGRELCGVMGGSCVGAMESLVGQLERVVGKWESLVWGN